jgi:hypothetical protein
MQTDPTSKVKRIHETKRDLFSHNSVQIHIRLGQFTSLFIQLLLTPMLMHNFFLWFEFVDTHVLFPCKIYVK